MACAHPFGVDPIRDPAGKLIGGRCPVCRSTAYVGESVWSLLWRYLTRRGRS